MRKIEEELAVRKREEERRAWKDEEGSDAKASKKKGWIMLVRGGGEGKGE